MHCNARSAVGRGCYRLGLCLLAMLMIQFEVLGEEAGGQMRQIKPDPEMQAAIRRILTPEDETTLQMELDHLRKEDGPHYRKLIPQLLYYSMHGTDREGKHDVREAMALGLIAKQLEISDGDIFAAIVPYLDTDDEALHKALLGVFSGFENASAGRPPDFSRYGGLISWEFRTGKEPSWGLIRYMYERNPGVALLTVTRAAPSQERGDWKAILWGEHAIADVLWKHEHKFLPEGQVEPTAAQQLEKLSMSDHWWVRLYVAEIMRQYKGFRQKKIIERLKQDEHPLVRKAVQVFADAYDVNQ